MDTALVHEFLSCIKHFNQTCAWHQMQKHVMGEILVLDRLRRYGQTTPGNLSKQLQLSTARTAAILNSLEKKAFITRTPSAVDRRKTELNITRRGIETLDQGFSFLESQVSNLLDLLGEEDSREFIRILNRIAALQPELRLCCPPNQHTIPSERKE